MYPAGLRRERRRALRGDAHGVAVGGDGAGGRMMKGQGLEVLAASHL